MCLEPHGSKHGRKSLKVLQLLSTVDCFGIVPAYCMQQGPPLVLLQKISVVENPEHNTGPLHSYLMVVLVRTG